MGNNNSRSKKNNKPKQPIVFAKDKKQATIAMVVLFLFLANTVYMIIKHFQEANPTPVAAQNASSLDAKSMENQQHNNLANLTTPGAVSPTSPTDPASPANPPQDQNIQKDANNIYSQTMDLQKGSSAPVVNPNQASKTAQAPEGDVDILQKTTSKKNGKMVVVTISNSGRQDPFLPTSDGPLSGAYSYLLPPPQTLPQNTDASKVMETTISGILYDQYSPSAILNIEGTDYLVKKGDVIKLYKILGISKTQVTVQLGKNIYHAGVGELLTQSDFSGNLANLNKKFGGNDVSINVRRKGY